MPVIHIKGLVSFATNYGVWVHEEALNASPDQLLDAVRVAYEHLNDPPLQDACCGGMGPLAGYSDIDFEDYLELLRTIEIENAGQEAKKIHTKARRSEFNGRRSHLVLALLNAGVPYECAEADCEVISDLTVDHIIPLSRGGTDDLDNLRFMCRAHNSSKGDKHEA